MVTDSILPKNPKNPQKIRKNFLNFLKKNSINFQFLNKFPETNFGGINFGTINEKGRKYEFVYITWTKNKMIFGFRNRQPEIYFDWLRCELKLKKSHQFYLPIEGNIIMNMDNNGI